MPAGSRTPRIATSSIPGRKAVTPWAGCDRISQFRGPLLPSLRHQHGHDPVPPDIVHAHVVPVPYEVDVHTRPGDGQVGDPPGRYPQPGGRVVIVLYDPNDPAVTEEAA